MEQPSSKLLLTTAQQANTRLLSEMLNLERLTQFTRTEDPANPARRIWVAIAKVATLPDEGIWGVFTIGSLSNDLFFALTTGEPKKVGRILAAIELHAASTEIGFGDTIRTDDQYMRDNGRVAAVLLRAETITAYSHVPTAIDLHGEHRHIYLVTFLDRVEYAAVQAGGLDALFTQFDQDAKDFVAIRGPRDLS